MYTSKIITHKGESRITIAFEKKQELINRFTKLKGAKWSATLRTWHLPNTTEYRIAPISREIVALLRQYYKAYKSTAQFGCLKDKLKID